MTHNAEVYRFSNPLRDILDRVHREKSRDNMQKLSTAIRNAFGDDVLSEIILADVGKSESPFIVIDGVRRESDIKYLRNLQGFRLIYIDADIKVRYTRITFR